MKRIMQLLFCASLISLSCRKQNIVNTPANNTHFANFNSRNSPLPDDQVNTISAFRNTVWIGTQAGLAKKSNGAWKVYTQDNSGLPSSVILSLAAVSEDCAWVGTDKGLVKLCQDQFTVYNKANSLMMNNVVKKIVLDKERNSVWAGTEGGILKLSGDTQEWFDESNSGLLDNVVTALAVTPAGKLVVGSFDHFQFQGSAWQFNGNQWSRIRLNELGYASTFINAIATNGEEWWMGVGGTSTGAVLAMKNGQAIAQYNNQNSPIQGGVQAIAKQDGNWWIVSGTGLHHFKEGQWKSFSANNSQLPDDTFLCMLAEEHRIFLGTLQNGLVEFWPGK